MAMICSNDARIESYDFKYRADYRDTYRAFGRMSELAFDPGRLSEHLGIDWDRSWLLKTPLAMDSNSSFFVYFSSFVLLLSAASNPCFDCFGLLLYYALH